MFRSPGILRHSLSRLEDLQDAALMNSIGLIASETAR